MTAWKLSAAVALFSSATLSAAPPAPLVNPTGAYQPTGAASGPKGEGLASLDDRALGAELSSRGIANLLDHYFKANGVPEADQQAIKTVGALRELVGPRADKIPYGEKLRRVRQIAEGIDTVLPTIKDPAQMMTTAGILIEFGVTADVNSLEYWGEDPVTQSQLKPMTAAVIKLYSAAAKTAQAQADDLANKLRGGNDPNADRWERLDNLAHTAAYSKNMAVYFDALATNPKDPSRKAMAEAAIRDLKEFDNPESGVQAKIRLMISKLNMVAGDYAAAKKNFASLYSGGEVKPAPNPFEQYEARYFMVVTDILSKELAAAQKDKAALDKWQKDTLPGLLGGLKLTAPQIADYTKGISAAGQMLQWRVHVLEGDLAKANSPAKKKADDAAEAVLLKLRADRPDLAPRIDQQLVNRMPANKVIDDKMAPSLLLALLKKGMNESYKSDAEKPDPVVLNKGIEAASAIVHRKDRAGLTPQNVAEAQLAMAALQERVGKKVDAINSYLDFATDFFKTEPKKATDSLDRAGYMVFDMKKQPVQPDGFAEVYNRFLPMAINPPYNHKELAYLYAEQLRGVKKYADALKFYRLVPKESPAYELAQYKQMVVLEEMLDTRQAPAEHAQTVAELTKIAEVVRKMGEHPKDDSERTKAIRATLVLADLARTEQKDAKRVLEVLQGFDELVNGLSPGKTKAEMDARAAQKAELLRSALVVRINAYIGTGQTNMAVQELTKLLQEKPEDGINLVREVLAKLDQEYAHADLIHDTAVMRDTARNEASLTGYLVDWSRPPKQKNPDIAKYYYAYALYDARTQRLAGSQAGDPAEQKKLLNQALDRYHALEAKEMHDLYINQPDVKKRIKDGQIDAADPDPQVAIGLALTEFDLGDFKSARDHLEMLIANKKLGTPQAEEIDPKTGEAHIKDNDLYWEATYKFLKSGEEVAKGDAKATDVVAKSLKNILIRGGIPERWQDEFDGLKKDLAPDFDPGKIAASPARPATPASPAAPPAAPASQPSAAAK